MSDPQPETADPHVRPHPDPDPHPDPHGFWEARYGGREQIWSGRPNAALVDAAGALVPGRALELGCGEGADAVWLAQRGWQVTAVDLSETAVARGRAAADRLAIASHQIDWIAADLTGWCPDGEFELVSACFFHSPVALARAAVLRRAAAAVAAGGHLLIVGHAEAPPWADPHPHADRGLRTPEEQIAELELSETAWSIELAELRERRASWPDGRPATLRDAVLLARRR